MKPAILALMVTVLFGISAFSAPTHAAMPPPAPPPAADPGAPPVQPGAGQAQPQFVLASRQLNAPWRAASATVTATLEACAVVTTTLEAPAVVTATVKASASATATLKASASATATLKASASVTTTPTLADKLVGTWVDEADEETNGTIVFMNDGQMCIMAGEITAYGTYVVDFSVTPAKLDMEGDWTDGKTLTTIIEFVDDDTIRIENIAPGKTRPAAFSRTAMTLTRQGEPWLPDEAITPTVTSRVTATVSAGSTPKPSPTRRPSSTPRPTSTPRSTWTPRPSSTPRPTSTPAATGNQCKLEPGQSGILLTNPHDYKVLLTIGGGEWGTHDYWFEPKSTTPIQFPPGSYTATLTLPGKGNYKFSDGKVDFKPGVCYPFRVP